MTPLIAKLIWIFGVVGWFVIRYPYQRRSRRTPKAERRDRQREFVLLGIAVSGMFIVPLVYCLSDEPRFADYRFSPLQAWCGGTVFAAALYLFHRTHHDLGRNWSATLVIRDRHALVTSGIYHRIRHPMYLAFWLWAFAQALLLANWVAGPAGVLGFGALFFLRVGREERMMLETFGAEYRAYMARTHRLIPGIY